MIKALFKRPPWEDRYTRPSLEQLIAGMANENLAELVRAACEAFAAVPRAGGDVTWQGIPWRWAAVYTIDDEPRPFGYVIPQPSKPLVAVPVSIDLVRSLPTRKLSKSLKDAIIFAPQVGEQLWPTWELGSKTIIPEIMSIVERRLAEPAAARAGSS